MSTELTVPLVAGLFGLVPLLVQIATTRAQRRDRITRLNQLRAEMELLERLHTLQGKVGATDEAAKPQTNHDISNSLSKILDQYNKLSELQPSRVVGGNEPSQEKLSFFRRMFLLYTPNSVPGWVLHTLFYTLSLVFWTWTFFFLVGGSAGGYDTVDIAIWAIVATPLIVLLLIIRHLARRHTAKFED